ncbi:hypothetical protein SYNTR_2064 [Candidatus Syntrophocurvum alkaliphilum]|uniref:Uncharacterized protein n=1 Tax=Candidatus Syntrophocurvum alkaliphilum TaxID=2293317 RepID=A0A6I6DP45_9FIRM|nr:hypothetical protein [Candidatus Syntrophocurvum alkaliphilum]QGU00658.1 hypothetical protein SYNTR_2064 [Candidatus Syntrophocurvum alkaliphilum]
MKKLSYLLIVAFIFSIGIIGCNDTNDNPQDVPADKNGQEWKATIEENIVIEGMEETITLELFEGNNNFVTYIPESMAVETEFASDGDFYWFYWMHEENINEDVYLQLYFYPEAVTETPSLSKTENLKLVDDTEKIYNWSIGEYTSSFEADNSFYAMIGKHEEQYFSIVLHYPWEYGDGLNPRFNKIIEHFYWTDTDKYLNSNSI